MQLTDRIQVKHELGVSLARVRIGSNSCGVRLWFAMRSSAIDVADHADCFSYVVILSSKVSV
jgi:hypothetical protein